ncbi:hypothetical protein E3Q07_03769 [Wallemia mellicola]|nr:hypothetical protein E3Q07_03769 [Wallemia mellicola]
MPKNENTLKRGQACLSCRKRKARCDGEKPACGNCIKGNKECVYIDISGRNAAVRKDKVQKLEERMRDLEQRLESQHISPAMENDIADDELLDNYNMDTTSSLAGFSGVFASPAHQFHATLTPPPSNSLASIEWPYPPLDLTLHLVDTFFNSCPFVAHHLHKPTFFQKVLLPSSHPEAPHPSLIYAILACASRHSPRTSNPEVDDEIFLYTKNHNTFFDMATSIAIQCSEDESVSRNTIEEKAKTISAILIIIYLMKTEGKAINLHRFNALGMRGLISLRFHIDQSMTNARHQLVPLKNSFDKEQRKRMMFLFYIFDVLYSSDHVAYPGNLSSRHILLRLPVPSEVFARATRDTIILDRGPFINSPSWFEERHMDGFQCVIKSTILMDKVNQFLHESIQEVTNQNLSASNQLPAFGELDMLLTNHQSQLPDCWENYNGGNFNIDNYFAHVIALNALINLHNGYMQDHFSKSRLLGCVKSALSVIYSLLNTSFELSKLPAFVTSLYVGLAEILIAAYNQTNDATMRGSIKGELSTFIEVLNRMKKRIPLAFHSLQRLSNSLQRNGIFIDVGEEVIPTSNYVPIVEHISSFDVAAPMPQDTDIFNSFDITEFGWMDENLGEDVLASVGEYL